MGIKIRNSYQIPANICISSDNMIHIDEMFIPITNDIIPGVKDGYYISNYGKIYNSNTNSFMNYSIAYSNKNTNKPYYSIVLPVNGKSKSFRVHRLVMSAFYPEQGSIYQKMDINHKNGITNDNYISYNDPNRGNLEWTSHRDNMLHAYRTGLHHIGEDNVHTKISNDTAKQIIELLSTNMYTSKEICELVGNGATPHIVDDIRKKQCWTHLSDGYTFYQRPNRQFTENDIINFCQFFQDNKELAHEIGINNICRKALIEYGFNPENRYVETLRKIYVKKYYKHIVSKYNW